MMRSSLLALLLGTNPERLAPNRAGHSIAREVRQTDMGPGRPIKLSRFVTDTVFPLVGGPLRIAQKPEWLSPQMNARGAPSASPDAITQFEPDTMTTVFGNPRDLDHLLAHEAAHVMDARRLVPLSVRGQLGLAQDQHPRQDWLADPAEYLAEAFASALDSGRKGFADSMAVNRRLPGTLDLIHWLQTQPPFAKPQETEHAGH